MRREEEVFEMLFVVDKERNLHAIQSRLMLDHLIFIINEFISNLEALGYLLLFRL